MFAVKALKNNLKLRELNIFSSRCKKNIKNYKIVINSWNYNKLNIVCCILNTFIVLYSLLQLSFYIKNFFIKS